jgi:hypothetical protein
MAGVFDHLFEFKNVDAMIKTINLTQEMLSSWTESEPEHVTPNEEENKRTKAANAALRLAVKQDIANQHDRIRYAIGTAMSMNVFVEHVNLRESKYELLKRAKPQWIEYVDTVYVRGSEGV